jgi:hypothetical protein
VINLTGLAVQTAGDTNAAANGSISFTINVNAEVVAAPYGFVAPSVPVVFSLDASGNIKPNPGNAHATIWSNAELNPQNSVGLGTWYAVAIYDQNGACVSRPGMIWQFTQAANSTVNISEMIPVVTGGNVLYYPSPALINGNNIWTGSNTFDLTIVGNITGVISGTIGNVATTGVINLVDTDLIAWRNNANTGDVSLGDGGGAFGNIPADTLVWTGSGMFATCFITGNSPATAMSGDFRLINAGVGICWRNSANTADLALTCNGSNQLGWVGAAAFGTLIEANTHTPSSSTDTGITGQFAWDSTYFYVCTATNTWSRVAITHSGW